MNAPKLQPLWPLSFDSWGKEEVNAALWALISDRLTMGPKVAEFERAFAAMHGVRRAVMTNSGSSANLIAVAALFHAGKFRRGDEAIVPAIAWATTYAPLHQYGLKLKVVDVDIETLNADPAELEKALTPRTRLLVGVSILGNPAALGFMRQFADDHKLAFLEDNCESLGAKAEGGRLAGSFGHISTFSSFFSHHINTIEGGMLLTDSDAYADMAICLRAHGWTRDLPKESRFRSQGEPSEFSTDYDFVLPGFNVRPTEIAGAVGLVQLRRLDRMQEWRKANAQMFRSTFGQDERFKLQKLAPGAVPFGFTMICTGQEARRTALKRLAGAMIETRLITGGCFTKHRASALYDYETVGELPNAIRAHECGFFVGNHSHDLGQNIRSMKQALLER